MKIVLGICGFGYGHSTRQRPILEGLLARGHEVILITNDQSTQFFTQNYPNVRNARVYVPAMHITPTGLDFAATANDPRNALPEANPAFWNACGMIEREFGRANAGDVAGAGDVGLCGGAGTESQTAQTKGKSHPARCHAPVFGERRY